MTIRIPFGMKYATFQLMMVEGPSKYLCARISVRGHVAIAMVLVWFGVMRSASASWRDVFDPFEVVTVNLEIGTSDWDRVRFDHPSQSESWVPEIAEAWFNAAGETPIRVTVRRKGESDPALPSDADPRKVSLKIDINDLVPGQRWHGLSNLSLDTL